MHMAKRTSPIKVIVVAALVVGLAAAAYLLFASNQTVHAPEQNSPAQDNSQPTHPDDVIEPKPSYDTETASSIQVVINKQHPFNPIDYAPSPLLGVGNGQQMRTEAGEAFLRMQADAETAGAPIIATSGYRSYSYQKTVYDGYVAQYGIEETDTFSARPGFSEHQTGLVVDIQGGGCSLDNCFADTAQGKWIAANAHNYGFVLRYPSDKTDITGYTYEAWHWRYVGVELATDMHKQGIETLEEYFDITGGPNY